MLKRQGIQEQGQTSRVGNTPKGGKLHKDRLNTGFRMAHTCSKLTDSEFCKSKSRKRIVMGQAVFLF